jgi:hypothetical protein
MKKNKILILLSFLALIAAVVLALNQNAVEPDEQSQIREYADPAAEKILQSFNSGDYSQFSETFSEMMKSSIPDSLFLENRNMIVAKAGEYVSKEFYKQEEEGLYQYVYYKADFSNEEDVSVLIIFEEIKGEMKVSGLWLDSPKIRE